MLQLRAARTCCKAMAFGMARARGRAAHGRADPRRRTRRAGTRSAASATSSSSSSTSGQARSRSCRHPPPPADTGGMIQAAGCRCAACGRANDDAALVCRLCGALLRRERVVEAARPPTRSERVAVFPVESPGPSRARGRGSRGSTSASARDGADLRAHAAARVHGLVPRVARARDGAQRRRLVLRHAGVPGDLARGTRGGGPLGAVVALRARRLGAGSAAAWQFLAGRARWIALGIVAVLYPAARVHRREGAPPPPRAATAASSRSRRSRLWKTLDGGFTESRLERGLYGTVGWYLARQATRSCASA